MARTRQSGVEAPPGDEQSVADVESVGFPDGHVADVFPEAPPEEEAASVDRPMPPEEFVGLRHYRTLAETIVLELGAPELQGAMVSKLKEKLGDPEKKRTLAAPSVIRQMVEDYRCIVDELIPELEAKLRELLERKKRLVDEGPGESDSAKERYERDLHSLEEDIVRTAGDLIIDKVYVERFRVDPTTRNQFDEKGKEKDLLKERAARDPGKLLEAEFDEGVFDEEDSVEGSDVLEIDLEFFRGLAARLDPRSLMEEGKERESAQVMDEIEQMLTGLSGLSFSIRSRVHAIELEFRHRDGDPIGPERGLVLHRFEDFCRHVDPVEGNGVEFLCGKASDVLGNPRASKREKELVIMAARDAVLSFGRLFVKLTTELSRLETALLGAEVLPDLEQDGMLRDARKPGSAPEVREFSRSGEIERALSQDQLENEMRDAQGFFKWCAENADWGVGALQLVSRQMELLFDSLFLSCCQDLARLRADLPPISPAFADKIEPVREEVLKIMSEARVFLATFRGEGGLLEMISDVQMRFWNEYMENRSENAPQIQKETDQKVLFLTGAFRRFGDDFRSLWSRYVVMKEKMAWESRLPVPLEEREQDVRQEVARMSQADIKETLVRGSLHREHAFPLPLSSVLVDLWGDEGPERASAVVGDLCEVDWRDGELVKMMLPEDVRNFVMSIVREIKLFDMLASDTGCLVSLTEAQKRDLLLVDRSETKALMSVLVYVKECVRNRPAGEERDRAIKKGELRFLTKAIEKRLGQEKIDVPEIPEVTHEFFALLNNRLEQAAVSSAFPNSVREAIHGLCLGFAIRVQELTGESLQKGGSPEGASEWSEQGLMSELVDVWHKTRDLLLSIETDASVFSFARQDAKREKIEKKVRTVQREIGELESLFMRARIHYIERHRRSSDLEGSADFEEIASLDDVERVVEEVTEALQEVIAGVRRGEDPDRAVIMEVVQRITALGSSDFLDTEDADRLATLTKAALNLLRAE